jgi:hypothetical protein
MPQAKNPENPVNPVQKKQNRVRSFEIAYELFLKPIFRILKNILKNNPLSPSASLPKENS